MLELPTGWKASNQLPFNKLGSPDAVAVDGKGNVHGSNHGRWLPSTPTHGPVPLLGSAATDGDPAKSNSNQGGNSGERTQNPKNKPLDHLTVHFN